jgi:hypothetical protein
VFFCSEPSESSSCSVSCSSSISRELAYSTGDPAFWFYQIGSLAKDVTVSTSLFLFFPFIAQVFVPVSDRTKDRWFLARSDRQSSIKKKKQKKNKRKKQPDPIAIPGPIGFLDKI